MRLLIGLLIAGLVIGVVSLVMSGGEGGYWADPSQWNRTIERTSHTVTREAGEQREYTGVTRYEQTDVVGSREMHTGVSGEAQGSLFGGVQQSYESHATYDDGGEQRGSFKDSTTYSLRIHEADGTQREVEGSFDSPQ